LCPCRKVGDPFSADTQHGPQINDNQLNKIMKYVEEVRHKRAEGGWVNNRILVGRDGPYLLQEPHGGALPRQACDRLTAQDKMLALNRLGKSSMHCNECWPLTAAAEAARISCAR
jgi:hypothetical protein